MKLERTLWLHNLTLKRDTKGLFVEAESTVEGGGAIQLKLTVSDVEAEALKATVEGRRFRLTIDLGEALEFEEPAEVPEDEAAAAPLEEVRKRLKWIADGGFPKIERAEIDADLDAIRHVFGAWSDSPELGNDPQTADLVERLVDISADLARILEARR
jgi:hypothetical protein